jgi:hypothetical protein
MTRHWRHIIIVIRLQRVLVCHWYHKFTHITLAEKIMIRQCPYCSSFLPLSYQPTKARLRHWNHILLSCQLIKLKARLKPDFILTAHILRRNCRLKNVIGGSTEGTRRRGRSCKQLLYDLRETKCTGNWKTEHYIALCGELTLQKVVELS